VYLRTQRSAHRTDAENQTQRPVEPTTAALACNNNLGRGTLREIADIGDARNRYYDWAVEHRDYHFAGEAGGASVYRAFSELFDSHVPDLGLDSLVEACSHSDILAFE
jgi:hypothetical protein